MRSTPRTRGRWTLGVLLLVFAATSCARTSRIRLRFDAVDTDRAAAFETWLVPGDGCESDPARLAATLVAGPGDGRHASFHEAGEGELFSTLGEGAQRLMVLVRDRECRPIQVGCADFRPSSTAEVVVRMEPVSLDASVRCEPPSGCAMGLCDGPPEDAGPPMDAGPADAGPADAGDGAPDGGSGDPDATVPDAGPEECTEAPPTSAELNCASAAECGPDGFALCTSGTCSSAPLERARGLIGPTAGMDLGDELDVVLSPIYGDVDGHIRNYVGVMEHARGSSADTGNARFWNLHESETDDTALVAGSRGANPALVPFCTVAPDPITTFDAQHQFAVGSPLWANYGLLGTVDGQAAIAVGTPLDDGAPNILVQHCTVFPDTTFSGPTVVAGPPSTDQAATYVWVEVNASGTFLTRYHRSGPRRIAFPAISLEGIAAASTPLGYHVAYELGHAGPVFFWDSLHGTDGYELRRDDAAGAPSLATADGVEYLLAYPASLPDCSGTGVRVREVSCAAACLYTGREVTVPRHLQHVQITALDDGWFVMVGFDVATRRVVARLFDDALRPVAIDGSWSIDVRTLSASEDVRGLALAHFRSCESSPPTTRISVATMLGDGSGPPARVAVDLLRHPSATCPVP